MTERPFGWNLEVAARYCSGSILIACTVVVPTWDKDPRTRSMPTIPRPLSAAFWHLEMLASNEFPGTRVVIKRGADGSLVIALVLPADGSAA